MHMQNLTSYHKIIFCRSIRPWIMIYDTIATKFIVCYFLCSIVFVLFISSKLINIGRKNYEKKTLKYWPSKRWKLHFRKKTSTWKCLLSPIANKSFGWSFNYLVFEISRFSDQDSLRFLPNFWAASSTYLQWINFHVVELCRWLIFEKFAQIMYHCHKA